ncbi:MAG TPA: virulence-associated protein E [Aurantimonas coralicida]|uniref:Virulence-associated protein E n=2 Tax=root TaxID=1 RepID=A0A9C9NID7_9HYPH|nr:virulence-associated protein E [Aurantimonas coralicida]HEU01930.1 virulence-associated protein E [Aurantimonas coralicida]
MADPIELQQIANALGGDTNDAWINIPGPGHGSADRSLGFMFDKQARDGFRLFSFANDDPLECRKYVKARLRTLAEEGLPRVPKAVTADDEAVSQGQSRIESALKIWAQSVPASGTVVQTYLAGRGCGLLTPLLDNEVRFHPCCPFGSGTQVPAMIALMRDILTGVPTGIHRTALQDDGKGKLDMGTGASKRMLGVAKRAAVQLQPASTVLGIAEGIETALSAAQIFRKPVWAVLSAGGMATFPIIPGLKRLVVFADHDDAGLAAAEACATRYSAAGVGGEIRPPETRGSDWNDWAREGVR